MVFLRIIIAVISLLSYGNGLIETSNSVEPRVIDLGQGYLVGINPVTYAYAKELCEFAGKVLVSIETPEEDKLILNLLRNNTEAPIHYIWTSGRNSISPFNWLWGSTGEPLYYSRWEPPHPAYNHNNYCLALTYDEYYRYWFSFECTNSAYPLCESRN